MKWAGEGWVIAAAGAETQRRFEAPVEIEGWSERPWVELRPLTAREALQRESLGLREELEGETSGGATVVRRRYDLEAMVAYELRRCVVDYALPVAEESGRVRCARAADGLEGELLDRLPTRLMDWLARCLDEINLRRPEDAREPEGADAGRLHEGRDFLTVAELRRRLEVGVDG